MLRSLRAMPTLLRIGFAEAIVYRAEMLVWVFATTMPLVMLMLWTAVAEVAPVLGAGKTWHAGSFVAYFLTVFIVRQLISSWASWEISFEVRQGTLAMRLLRPLHPVTSYMMQNLAYLPLRTLVTLPVVLVVLLSDARTHLATSRGVWALCALSLLGGWVINFFANIFIGALSFFIESSIKVMDVWLAAFFVFSGYLYPLDLFPQWLRAVAQWLPFRYQIGLPVELATGAVSFDEGVRLLLVQWSWALGFIVLAFTVWRAGVRRFQAFGG